MPLIERLCAETVRSRFLRNAAKRTLSDVGYFQELDDAVPFWVNE